ncbi:YcdB/YcdC domain-containing protein [Brevibacillus daliensis]|uniref:YcdB/YcdC domain-containing protein n=1 Tax=Brevibacillus daliensis TaxID=2892995 RepID=UPI001E5B9093|nr:YcdB/YcdC domain-containing protein [Brevibacillus daliensis]
MKKHMWNRAIFLLTVSLLTTSAITIGPEVIHASKGQASLQTTVKTGEAVTNAKSKEQKTFPKEYEKTVTDFLKKYTPLNGYQIEGTQYMEKDEHREAHWRVELVDTKTKKSYVDLEIGEKTGQIVGLYANNDEWASDTYPTEKLAREKADEFVKILLGKEAENYKSREWLGGGLASHSDENGKKTFPRLSVHYERYVNGISSGRGGISVSVNQAGVVTRYHVDEDTSIDTASFPKPDDVIKKEDAGKKIWDAVKLTPSYYTAFKVDRYPVKVSDKIESFPLLTYNQNNHVVVDAKSGKVEIEEFPSEIKRVSISGEGKELVVKNREEVEKMILGMGMNVAGWDYREEKEDPFFDDLNTIQYSWSQDVEGKDYQTIGVEADKETGKVLHFYTNARPVYNKDKIKITEEEAQKIALSFLDKHVTGTKELILSEIDKPGLSEWQLKGITPEEIKQMEKKSDNIYSVYFYEVYQNTKVVDQIYFVQLNAETGEVLQMGVPSRPTGNLPEFKKAVSIEKAKEAFQKEYEVTLSYEWYDEEGKKLTTPRLIYQLEKKNRGSFFDAITGEFKTK